MRRVLKVLMALVALGLAGLAGLAAARQTAFLLGAGKADEILGAASSGQMGSAEIKRLALWTHEQFKNYSEESASGEPLLYRVAPYLTNRRIPEPFRLPPGAIETLYGDGLCDSAARTLGFLAAAKGLAFRQYNLVAASAAHSAVEIESADGPVYVDPFFGGVERDPVGADAVLASLKQGVAPEVVLEPLTGEADLSFYRLIDARARGGFQGGGLTVDFTLPREAVGKALGQRDGRWEDVGAEGTRLGISIYFSYLGSRFDRSWTRELRVEEPVEIKLYTVGPLDRGLIDGVVEPAPEEIGEDWALWRIGPDRPLVLDDSRSPLRLSLSANWQAIDRIEITRP